MAMPILVLSLPDAAERRAATREEMGRHDLSFRFFNAVDGRSMTETQFDAAYDPACNAQEFKRPLGRGEVGCALGHRAIWREISEGKAPVSLVCEDDLTFLRSPRSFLAAAEAISHALEDIIVKLDGDASRGESLGQLGETDLILSTRLPPRTTGYLIGCQAARRLVTTAVRVTRPVDIALKHYWEHGVPILVAHPPLIEVVAGFRTSC